jgi:hypothetical protein
VSEADEPHSEGAADVAGPDDSNVHIVLRFNWFARRGVASSVS